VVVVGGIVQRDGKIGAALLAVEIGDDLAAEVAARDFQRAALAGHQRIEIDVGPGLFLGTNRRGQEAGRHERGPRMLHHAGKPSPAHHPPFRILSRAP
jgi:hypothetical protein